MTKGLPQRHTATLVVLGMLATCGPMLTDLSLPGLPQMAADFGIGATDAQLTLTAALTGVALGQLVLGPLSDHGGRRIPLLVGLSLAVMAGLASWAAPTLPLLIAARLLQGFGIAAGLVISRAVVSDSTRDARTMRWLSVISVIAGMGSLVAPVLGGALTVSFGWRAPLGALVGDVVLVLLAVLLVLRETHPMAR